MKKLRTQKQIAEGAGLEALRAVESRRLRRAAIHKNRPFKEYDIVMVLETGEIGYVIDCGLLGTGEREVISTTVHVTWPQHAVNDPTFGEVADIRVLDNPEELERLPGRYSPRQRGFPS